MLKITWMPLAVASLVVGLVACGEEENANPNPPRSQQQQSGLSAAYATNCARCHGDTGTGGRVNDVDVPGLPNGKDEAGYIAGVRAGKGETMAAFSAADISDADLKADFVWMTTVRK